MSKTKRTKPLKKLTPKEEKLVKKGKLHSPADVKGEVEPHFSQAAKKEAKKEKHRKQRSVSKKEIDEVKKDD